MRTEVTILNGLNVTVEFTACRAEPEVGIMSDYAEDWHIVAIAGRELAKNESPDWIYKRIANTKDEDKILTACHMRMSDSYDDYDYD